MPTAQGRHYHANRDAHADRDSQYLGQPAAVYKRSDHECLQFADCNLECLQVADREQRPLAVCAHHDHGDGDGVGVGVGDHYDAQQVPDVLGGQHVPDTDVLAEDLQRRSDAEDLQHDH